MAAAGVAVVSPVSAMINNVTGGNSPKAASEREQDQVGSPARRTSPIHELYKINP